MNIKMLRSHDGDYIHVEQLALYIATLGLDYNQARAIDFAKDLVKNLLEYEYNDISKEKKNANEN